MRHFSTFFFMLVACTATIIASCEGPEGPAGATGVKGDTGAPGAAGVKGDKGETGTANVIYTNWFTPEWSELYRSPDNLYILLNVTNTSHSILTEEAIDKSAIYVYIRYNDRVWNNQDGEYQLQQRVATGSGQWGSK
jgi:hypothetical protein